MARVIGLTPSPLHRNGAPVWLVRIAGTGRLRGMESADARRELSLAAEATAGAPVFAPDRPVALARAPGRLDVMGGISDYSGALVLQMPLREAARAMAQPAEDDRLLVVSPGGDDVHRRSVFRARLSDLLPGGEPLAPEAARAWFHRDPLDAWAAYALGPLLMLMRAKGLRPTQGLSLVLMSDVPEGRGVSSSAAVEVASLLAAAGAYGVDLDPDEAARLAQQAENLVAGAPCGIMDQMTSVRGEAGKLLALLCRPATVEGQVTIPPGLAVWGLDSGVRHSVGGAAYARVRVAAFMGSRILNHDAPDLAAHTHLAELSPSLFADRLLPLLPESLSTEAFERVYGETGDPVARPQPETRYPIRVCTRHPIYEHHRSQVFREILADGAARESAREMLGELMLQSHASYSDCGLGCAETDRIVAEVRRLGPARGLYGARITGGGSGGTVAILGRAEAGDAIREVADAYAAETGRTPRIFEGSSDGAWADAVHEQGETHGGA